MFHQTMFPEHVRIVHDRQIVEITRAREIARQREIARLAGPGLLLVLRRVAGAALVRAGRAIGSQPDPVSPVPGRPGIRTT